MKILREDVFNNIDAVRSKILPEIEERCNLVRRIMRGIIADEVERTVIVTYYLKVSRIILAAPR
jgi:hypothetical protein